MDVKLDTRPRLTRREVLGSAIVIPLLVGCGSSEVQKIGDSPPPVALGARPSEVTAPKDTEKDFPLKRFETAIKKGIELERKHPEVFKGASTLEVQLRTLHRDGVLIINESQNNKNNFKGASTVQAFYNTESQPATGKVRISKVTAQLRLGALILDNNNFKPEEQVMIILHELGHQTELKTIIDPYINREFA